MRLPSTTQPRYSNSLAAVHPVALMRPCLCVGALDAAADEGSADGGDEDGLVSSDRACSIGPGRSACQASGPACGRLEGQRPPTKPCRCVRRPAGEVWLHHCFMGQIDSPTDRPLLPSLRLTHRLAAAQDGSRSARGGAGAVLLQGRALGGDETHPVADRQRTDAHGG